VTESEHAELQALSGGANPKLSCPQIIQDVSRISLSRGKFWRLPFLCTSREESVQRLDYYCYLHVALCICPVFLLIHRTASSEALQKLFCE
jgi:hypothetical protein